MHLEPAPISFLVPNARGCLTTYFIPLYPDFPGRCLSKPFQEPLMTAIPVSKVLGLG